MGFTEISPKLIVDAISNYVHDLTIDYENHENVRQCKKCGFWVGAANEKEIDKKKSLEIDFSRIS